MLRHVHFQQQDFDRDSDNEDSDDDDEDEYEVIEHAHATGDCLNSSFQSKVDADVLKFLKHINMQSLNG